MKKIALMMILALLPMLANAYTWTKPGEAVRMTWFDTAAPDYYMRLLEEGTVSNPTAPLSDLKLQASPKIDDTRKMTVIILISMPSGAVAARAPQAKSRESPGRKGVTTRPVSQKTTRNKMA